MFFEAPTEKILLSGKEVEALKALAEEQKLSILIKEISPEINGPYGHAMPHWAFARMLAQATSLSILVEKLGYKNAFEFYKELEEMGL